MKKRTIILHCSSVAVLLLCANYLWGGVWTKRAARRLTHKATHVGICCGAASAPTIQRGILGGKVAVTGKEFDHVGGYNCTTFIQSRIIYLLPGREQTKNFYMKD
jgi:hypothetical protein